MGWGSKNICNIDGSVDNLVQHTIFYLGIGTELVPNKNTRKVKESSYAAALCSSRALTQRASAHDRTCEANQIASLPSSRTLGYSNPLINHDHSFVALKGILFVIFG